MYKNEETGVKIKKKSIAVGPTDWVMHLGAHLNEFHRQVRDDQHMQVNSQIF